MDETRVYQEVQHQHETTHQHSNHHLLNLGPISTCILIESLSAIEWTRKAPRLSLQSTAMPREIVTSSHDTLSLTMLATHMQLHKPRGPHRKVHQPSLAMGKVQQLLAS
jgi:hypothetical protein